MKAFRVTTINRQHHRHSQTVLARNWFDAWLYVANKCGVDALVSVRPAK